MLYQELFFRNQGVFSAKDQRQLNQAKVAIIGLGGTGGFLLENLLRLGVQDFVLFDSDRFELSNMNRQLLATMDSLDKPKPAGARARAKSINPKVRIKGYTERFTASCRQKLVGCSAVFDCTDNLASRFEIAEACRKLRIPFIFCSAALSQGMISVFYPTADFGRIFGHLKNNGKTCSSVICPAPAFAASLAAHQGTRMLIGRLHVRAPEFIFFDLDSKKILWRQKL